jgi:AcrR family transcriptional regulator
MSKLAKFNREDVIAKATNLYWEKGFHGTSMRNLQDVIDMRPGSIYASFGSKENLFKEAIQHYSAQGRKNLQACLKEQTSPLGALKLFIKTAIIDNRTTAPSGMCMLVKTIGELTDEQNELLTEAKHQLSVMENEFAKVMQMAISAGELDPAKDPTQLAKYYQVQLIGLRTYARANADDAATEILLNDMFDTGPLSRQK